MACHCDLPVIITNTKRGWSRGEWSVDSYCGNCGEAITPRGLRNGRKLSRKERSAKAKARWSDWTSRWAATRRAWDNWKESHYDILGLAHCPGARVRVTKVHKPSWTNLGRLVPLTPGVIYTVVDDPNNDYLSKAAICLTAHGKDDHSEVTYYRVRPGEINGQHIK